MAPTLYETLPCGHDLTDDCAQCKLEQQLAALREGLERLISIAERCDGWEFFPSDELDAAISALQESE